MAFLTDREKEILREIYEVPAEGGLIIAGEGQGIPVNYFALTSGNASVAQRLETAIAALDLNEVRSTRVSEILAEYENFALDPSPIDKDGYSFRARRNMKAIYKALMPYTGILVRMGDVGNTTPLG